MVLAARGVAEGRPNVNGVELALRKTPFGPLRLFLADETGAELVEWAVLTVVLVTASYVVMLQVRTELALAFTRILRRFLGERFAPGAG